MINRYIGFMILSTTLSALSASAQPELDTVVFERIFGIPRTIDADTVEAVLALEPGEKLERDRDGDGKVDELWYIDTAKRHTIQPMLVRVVDEDGDMAETGRGDRDSDCYFWDHGADGSIDIVTDYVDDDGDNDVDQMGIYYDKRWPDEKDDLTVWWSVDIGDDNRLWFDVNGNYYQPLCQWRTHFGGDELFYQFRLTEDDERWVNVWEDPFAFYDPDGDLSSEMVIRISAVGDDVKNLRYSIDADDDAYGERTRNYDFSVTALPPEQGLTTAEWSGDPLTIRGIETMPLLSWEDTSAFSQQARWGKAMLTWDEINSNTDQDPDNDPHERWEGILNHASKHEDFEQVGGPPSSAYNKRVEVSHAPASPLQLRYSETDRRFHLAGANYGYMDVDFDFDDFVDAAYTWEDTNDDGILDRRTYDTDGDGTIDFAHDITVGSEGYDLVFESVAPAYKESLKKTLSESQRFIDAATAALGSTPNDVAGVLHIFAEGLPKYHPETELGEYIQKTPAGARLYTDLVRDRLFVHVHREFRDEEDWPKVESAYFAGDYRTAAENLAAITKAALREDLNDRPLEIDGQTYRQRVALGIEIESPQPHPRDAVPYSIDLAALKSKAQDFNADNCVVVDGDFRLAWRVIPHQIDDWEIGGHETLSFLADLPAESEKTYYVYYGPGKRVADYSKLTEAVLENPAYVAWESDAGAYRFYTGQFDFFGKHEWRTIPREERLIYPLVDVNYHAEQDWGIDALHVGKTSGLGGLTLYAGGETFPVQSPAGEGHVTFEHEVLGAGPVRSAVAITASNVVPDAPDKTVEIRCFAYARRTESEVQVRLPEGLDDPRLGIGLMHLPEGSPFHEEDLGLAGTWGRQGDDIGAIGLAVAAPISFVRDVVDTAGEQRLMCELPSYGGANDDRYHLRYWITGTWRRGMQYPIAPTGEDWQRRAADLAGLLNTNLKTHIEHERVGGK